MKYIKLFTLSVIALLFTACSDDETLNTLQTTAGFAQEELVIKENVGLMNIPINIEGYRNGDVSLVIESEGTGANPAIEGTHYRITDKTLSLLADRDTLSSTNLYVQVEFLDDKEINESREFTLSIARAEGATVTQKTLKVTIRDNDAEFFEQFYGKWTLTAVDHNGNQMSKVVKIAGPSDESDPDYNNVMWASCDNLWNLGISLTFEWPMVYTFDKATGKGTLTIPMYENYVATYSSAYKWVFVTDNGDELTTDPVSTTWQLTPDNKVPDVIEWDPEQTIWLYQPGAGWWAKMTNIKLSR